MPINTNALEALQSSVLTQESANDATLAVLPATALSAFATTSDKLTLMCAIFRTVNEETGSYAGENFVPINANITANFDGICRAITFHYAVTDQGEDAIIAVKHDADGHRNTWNRSLAHALELSKSSYVHVISNKALNRYDVEQLDIEVDLPSSVENFADLLLAALGGDVINSTSHPLFVAKPTEDDIQF